MKTITQVGEFHRAFNVPVKFSPELPDSERQELRIKLLYEELQELQDAMATGDLTGVLDALCDLQYVLDGTFLEFGMGHIKTLAFYEVHRSNMSKLGNDGKPILRDDKKVLKGPNFSGPDLKQFIEAGKITGPEDMEIFYPEWLKMDPGDPTANG